MFIKNIGKHSVVFVNYNQVNFTGINKFIANIGPSIRVRMVTCHMHANVPAGR